MRLVDLVFIDGEVAFIIRKPLSDSFWIAEQEDGDSFSTGQNFCKLARGIFLRKARPLTTRSDVFLVNSLNYAAFSP